MAVAESEKTPGLWFALTRTNKIEKVFYSEEKAKEHVRNKRPDFIKQQILKSNNKTEGIIK